jgi:hypothetical protein
MDKGLIFEDFFIQRNDALDNVAHNLAQLMLSADGVLPDEKAFPWNMEIICTILDHVEAVLNEKGYCTCWPYHGDDDTPCYILGECRHKDCRFKRRFLKNE